jgi:putative ABC transport system substrate-binding protein
MKRRRIVIVATCICLLGQRHVHAQTRPTPRLHIVGMLVFGSPSTSGRYIEIVKHTLAGLGWEEGRNVAYEVRWAEGSTERLPALARELVDLAPDIVWTAFTAAAQAVRERTRSIPIVVASSADPVGSGLAESLARPGGNVTGLSNLNAEIGPKLLELLLSAQPELDRVALLWNPNATTNRLIMERLREAAMSRRVVLVSLAASDLQQIDAAFSSLQREPTKALIVAADGVFWSYQKRVDEWVARLGLAAAVPERQQLGESGLFSYSQNSEELARRSATFLDRILRGARPADLPIEQASQLTLVINLRAAKALRITIPPSLLLRADEVIQ